MNLKDLELGDIILMNRRGKSDSFYSKAQRFFTGLPYTHSTIVVGDILSYPSVLSSDELTLLRPVQPYFEEPDTEIEIFRIKDFNKEIGTNVINNLYYDFSGDYYGFFQILWFIYRWLINKVFRKDIRKWNNPIKKGIICSELVYNYLKLYTYSMLYTTNDVKYSNLVKKMDEWNPDNIHAGDIALICKLFPEIFELIYKK